MAKIEIKPSTVVLAEKEAAEVCSLLGKLGVEFSFIPSKNPNRQDDAPLQSLRLSVRHANIVKIACEMCELDYETANISQFTEAVSLDVLKRIRGCGKLALEHIQDEIYRHGYALA
jgi:hypothetical protein